MNQPLHSQEAELLRSAYLKTLSRRLWGLPAPKRNEIERELASHLEMLVTEAQCDDASALEATKAALRQFGCPTQVGRCIAWEWHKENLMKTPRLVGGLSMFVVLFSTIWLLCLYASLSHVLFPSGKVLIMGSEGAKMSVQNGVVQVASGEAGVIGINPVALTLAIAIPFVVLLFLALVGCVSLVRRQPLSS